MSILKSHFDIEGCWVLTLRDLSCLLIGIIVLTITNMFIRTVVYYGYRFLQAADFMVNSL